MWAETVAGAEETAAGATAHRAAGDPKGTREQGVRKAATGARNQHVSDVPFEYLTDDLADELAVGMVAEAEWRPPECAALPP